jgi:hypothetical protein
MEQAQIDTHLEGGPKVAVPLADERVLLDDEQIRQALLLVLGLGAKLKKGDPETTPPNSAAKPAAKFV